MRMDALHYALLAVLVLLVFYAASTYGLFKEGRELMDTIAGEEVKDANSAWVDYTKAVKSS